MTGIEWADFTGNPWIGCTRILASSGALSGCELCYAATFAENRLGMQWGAGAERRPVQSFASRMRFSIFAMSLGDWLDAEIDLHRRSEFIEIIEECTNVNWLLLTHRPHLAKTLAPSSWRQSPPTNIWAGVTIDHRGHAWRWDQHAEFWAHTGQAWVSAEPLGSSLSGIAFDGAAAVIVGGASNTRDPAWAFQTAWLEEALEQYGDRVFFKQYGVFRDGALIGDKKRAGRDLNGVVFDRTPWPRYRRELSDAAAGAQP